MDAAVAIPRRPSALNEPVPAGMARMGTTTTAAAAATVGATAGATAEATVAATEAARGMEVVGMDTAGQRP